MVIEKSFELLERQELLISSQALKERRSNDHPEREYTLSKVEAEETRKGCDMI